MATPRPSSTPRCSTSGPWGGAPTPTRSSSTTSATTPSSSATTRARRSTRAWPTTRRSSSPRSRTCSAAACVPIDVALIQVSPPDDHGYISLGVSVDIVKAAVEKARVVIAQVNARMPRVHGDTFIHIDDVDFLVPHDEPLLEYTARVRPRSPERIGHYVARIVEDGDTIQVGYGSIPNAILANLRGKKHLGVHTELLTRRHRRPDAPRRHRQHAARPSTAARPWPPSAWATTTPTSSSTTTPRIEFPHHRLHQQPPGHRPAGEHDRHQQRPGDRPHRPGHRRVIWHDLLQRHRRPGRLHARARSWPRRQDHPGAAVHRRTATPSPASCPSSSEGAGVTLTRGDIHYVVTEYGIAYLHGKNIRERAMELIAIAHPKFRPGSSTRPRRLASSTRTRPSSRARRANTRAPRDLPHHQDAGSTCCFRPVKISDEPLLKDFFYSLSDESMYRRFMSLRLGHAARAAAGVRASSTTPRKWSSWPSSKRTTSEERRRRRPVSYNRGGAHTAEVGLRGARRLPEPGHRRGAARLPDLPGQGGRACSASPPRCWWRTAPCCTSSRRWGSTWKNGSKPVSTS